MIRQTKYWLAIAAFLVATIALLAMGLCTFAEWGTFVGTLFTMYSVSDITNTHLQQDKNVPKESQTS